MGYDYYDYYDSYDVSQYARGLDSSSSLMESNATNVLSTALGAFLGIIIIAIVVIAILQIIGMWKVYTKAGEKGWKAIIPFYNIAILYKISGMSPYLVFIYIALFIPFLNIFAAIALSIFTIYQRINLMKAFKASTALTTAMILVPFITYLVLGFGKSEYVGFDE